MSPWPGFDLAKQVNALLSHRALFNKITKSDTCHRCMSTAPLLAFAPHSHARLVLPAKSVVTLELE